MMHIENQTSKVKAFLKVKWQKITNERTARGNTRTTAVTKIEKMANSSYLWNSGVAKGIKYILPHGSQELPGQCTESKCCPPSCGWIWITLQLFDIFPRCSCCGCSICWQQVTMNKHPQSCHSANLNMAMNAEDKENY